VKNTLKVHVPLLEMIIVCMLIIR